MKKHTRALQLTGIAFGTALLVAAGSAVASAAPAPDDQNVDVNVKIDPIAVPGVLAMSVDQNSVSLSENGSTELVRQFTGTLPTVTVTDTRTADEIPDGAFWTVLGSASEFVDAGTGRTIGSENLGWEPALLQGEGEDFVSQGDDVQTALDGGPGLLDQELLFLADSEPAAGGTWSANAGLKLRVPASVEPGSYKSVLTLSLFE